MACVLRWSVSTLRSTFSNPLNGLDKSLISLTLYKRLFLSFVGAYLLFFVFIVFSNKQDLGGDFAQYFLMGRNIFSFKNPGYLLQNYPAVLPVWPLVIGFLDFIFGLNFYAIGVVNILLFSRVAYILSTKINAKSSDEVSLTSPAFSMLLFSATPFLERFEQAQPTFLYMWLLVEIFALSEKIEEKANSDDDDMKLALICVIGVLSRPEFLLFAVALPASLLMRRRDKWKSCLKIIALSVVTTQLYTVLGSSQMGQTQYGGVPTSGLKTTIFELTSTFLKGVLNLQPTIADFVATTIPVLNDYRYVIDWIPLAGGGLIFFCSILALWGALHMGTQASLTGFTLLLVWSLLFEQMRNTDLYSLRYILPYLPITLFFLFRGSVSLISASTRFALQGDHSFARVVIEEKLAPIVILVACTFLVPSGLKEPNFMIDRFRSTELQRSVELVAEEINLGKVNAEVGFFKPRTLQLLLDDEGIQVQVKYSGSPELVEEICSNGGFVVTHVFYGKGQEAISSRYLNNPLDGECEVVRYGEEYLVLASRWYNLQSGPKVGS